MLTIVASSWPAFTATHCLQGSYNMFLAFLFSLLLLVDLAVTFLQLASIPAIAGFMLLRSSSLLLTLAFLIVMPFLLMSASLFLLLLASG
jgi:hypothetical protein